MTEQSLALNLAVLDIDMTAAIKHSCNHLAFIIISRENVPYLSIIEINRDSLASGVDAFSRIVIKNRQTHIASVSN